MRASPLLFLTCITLFLVPGSTRGQYIYLDSNGDGVHDASDRVQSSGTTTVDVWLRTDANREGTAATCASEDGPLSMLSYEFILRASNGTIVWGTPQNRVPGLPTEFGLAQSSTEFHVGFYGPSPLPPGLYRLTTLALSVLDGTPSLEFASGASSLSGALQTAFGSSCSGLDFDNSMALGTEWFDADGLEYGGAVRHAPTLDPIPDQTVNEGENVERNITASDADGDPLTFAKSEGPAFMTVATLTPGTGIASGSIRFTPGFADAGLDTGGVSVSDGFATAQARFRIDVRNVNLAPVIRTVPELQVAAGSAMNYVASGYDPDGSSSLHFYKVSGPAFFNIDDLFPGTGIGAGLIWLTPSLADAGVTTAVIGLTDGMSVTEMTVTIRVTVAPVLEVVPDLSVQVGGFLTHELHAVSGDGDPVSFEKLRGPHFMSVATVDPGSGYASGRLTLTPVAFDAGTYDVAVRAFDGTDEDIATFRVKVFDPNGAAATTLFENAFLSYPLSNGPTNGVILDCNGDGKLDLVTLKYEMWPEPLTVSLGHGDGTFEFKQRIPSDDLPTSVAAADFDHDGIQDLAACSNYGPVSIYQGHGDGTFEQVAALPGGSNGYEIHAGDWDGDGSPDLAVVSHGEGLSIYHNRGGAFDEPVHYATGRFPRDMAVGDID